MRGIVALLLFPLLLFGIKLPDQLNPKGYYYTIKVLDSKLRYVSKVEEVLAQLQKYGLECRIRKSSDIPSDPLDRRIYLECGRAPKASMLMRYRPWFEEHGFGFMIVQVEPEGSSFITPKHRSIKRVRHYLPRQKKRLDDDTYRLVYQVYLYNTKLEKAYNVAKKALKRFPNSLYWHEAVAQVAMWTGREREALDEYYYIYKRRHKTDLAQKIVKLSFDFGSFDKAQEILWKELWQKYDAPKLEQFLYASEQNGELDLLKERLMRLYRKYKRVEILRALMSLAVRSEDEEMVERLRRCCPSDDPVVRLFEAYYEMGRRHFKEAYRLAKDALSRYDKKDSYYVSLLYLVSDLGWFFQDLPTSAKAALELMDLGKDRYIDDDRVFFYYQDKDKKIALRALQAQWRKKHQPYIFSLLVSYYYEAKDQQKMEQLVDELEHSKDEWAVQLRKDPRVKLALYYAYTLLGREHALRELVDELVEIAKDDYEVAYNLLWILIDSENIDPLKKLTFALQEKQIPQYLYIPLASALYKLQQSDRAYKYLRKVEKSYRNDPDIQLFLADIYYAWAKDDAAVGILQRLYRHLQAQLSSDPNLIKDQAFADIFLRSAMVSVTADRYLQILQRIKPYMDPDRFKAILVLWKLKLGSDEYARYIQNSMKRVEAWQRFAILLLFKEESDVVQRLYADMEILPIRDRVQGAFETMNYATGFTLAFEGLEANEKDYLLYYQFLQHVRDKADRILVGSYNEQRQNFSEWRYFFDWRHYLYRGWSFVGKGFYAKDSLSIPTIRYPSKRHEVAIGLRKLFDRGMAEVYVGKHTSFRDYWNLYAHMNYQLQARWNFDLLYATKQEAPDTDALLLAGRKDRIKAAINYQLLPSATIYVEGEYNRFEDQDGVDLGTAFIRRIGANRIYKEGYPDLRMRLFYEGASYDPKRVEDRTLLHLVDPNIAQELLPPDYDMIGLGIGYGLVQDEVYTRVWRLYFDVEPFYHFQNSSFNVNFKAGIGGMVYDRDHLDIGFEYDHNINGIENYLYRIYLKWQKHY